MWTISTHGKKGIPVVNVPTYGTASVSQFSIALLLEICHHIGHHSASVHNGDWAANPDWCYWDYPLIELAGKTIGIIGFGRIGQAEGRIAKAMGMRVLAYDVYPNDSGHAVGEYVDLDTLLAQSDVVSLHCNLTPENTGLINKETIAKMKGGAILLNNARGQLIVEQDVADALNSGKLAAAGLDVVYTEPIRPDNPLLTAKKLHPHAAYFLGSEGEPPTDHGDNRRKYPCVLKRNAAKRRQSLKAARPGAVPLRASVPKTVGIYNPTVLLVIGKSPRFPV